MIPALNWKELHTLAAALRHQLQGQFVDRIVVAQRPEFPSGYIKSEWTIRLTTRQQSGTLTFSLKPRQPYLIFAPGKGRNASTEATHSAFDLALSKHLAGAKLVDLVAVERERVLILKFSGSDTQFGLVLVMIPNAPEGNLVTLPEGPLQAGTLLPILASTRAKPATEYLIPDGKNAPEDPPIRFDFLRTTPETLAFFEKELSEQGQQERLKRAETILRARLKTATDRARQSETALREARKEQDWQRMGDLLKGSLGSPEEKTGTVRYVTDYATGEIVGVPCDPKLDLKEQIEKFYSLSKRRQRRLEESQNRMNEWREAAEKVEKVLAGPPNLAVWEEQAGIHLEAPTLEKKKAPRRGEWLGKSFKSKDGMTIWVGRSRDENLELTFKHAHGNDMWLHLRGKPGTHVVIPMMGGKSASLETLLDAANLVIHYSGGAHWGKTEVDYTLRKNVKRIKDSKEVSYRGNKSLLVTPDPVRLKRLLGQNSDG